MDLAPILARIGVDRDYSALELDGLTVDLQRWGSNHQIFGDLFDEVRPEVVIELGTWKGASVLWMHGLARKLGLATQFICIDTWLGSSEHWLADDDRQELGLRGGYPTLYRQFVFNVLAAGASIDVFPLPLTSTSAATVLEHLGVSLISSTSTPVTIRTRSSRISSATERSSDPAARCSEASTTRAGRAS